DAVTFDLSERIRQQRRLLTEEERKEHFRDQKWTQTKEPTGELQLKIKSAFPSGVPSSWQDEAQSPLEDKIYLVVVGFIVGVAYVRAVRERQEEEQHKQRQREEELRRLEQVRQAELTRKSDLRRNARNWSRAREI